MATAGKQRVKQQTGQSMFGARGNHWCNEKHVNVVSLAYDMKKSPIDTTTLIRFCPVLDYGTNYTTPTPYLHDPPDGPDDFDDWLRVYWAVRNFGGEDGITFFLSDEPQKTDFPFKMNPAVRIRNAMDSAIRQAKDKKRPPGISAEMIVEWIALTSGRVGHGAVIPHPNQMYVAPGLCYRCGDKDYPIPLGLGDKLALFPLSVSAGEALIDCAGRKRSTWDGHDTRLSAMAAIGRDPISLDEKSGMFFQFFPKGQDPRPGRQEANAKAKKDAKGYDVLALPAEGPAGKQRTPKLNAEEIAKVRSKLFKWEDVLVFHEFDKQAELLARIIDPKILMYAWVDTTWIDDFGVEARLKKIKTVELQTRRESAVAQDGDVDVPVDGEVEAPWDADVPVDDAGPDELEFPEDAPMDTTTTADELADGETEFPIDEADDGLAEDGSAEDGSAEDVVGVDEVEVEIEPEDEPGDTGDEIEPDMPVEDELPSTPPVKASPKAATKQPAAAAAKTAATKTAATQPAKAAVATKTAAAAKPVQAATKPTADHAAKLAELNRRAQALKQQAAAKAQK